MACQTETVKSNGQNLYMWHRKCRSIHDYYQCCVNLVKRGYIGNCQKWTKCVCETQMLPKLANSKDGQGHKDKYLDTNEKILTQEMLMCNMKALIVMTNVNF